MSIRNWAVILCVITVVMPAFANECECEKDENKGPWSGDYALGYLASSGNTDDKSLTVNVLTGYSAGAWTHALRGRVFTASKDSESTSESYQAGWKTKYDFSANDYLFGALDWTKDRFSSFTRQTFTTAGYGRRILNSERFILNAEIGAGYAKQRAIISETEFETLKENQDGGVGTFGGNFTWNISDNAAFRQGLTIFQTSDNTRTESVSSVTAGLLGNVGLVLSYTVLNNSDVAPGFDKTDTYTSVALNYSF